MTNYRAHLAERMAELLARIAEEPSTAVNREYWQHEANRLASDWYGETNACPVVSCSYCRVEHVEAVEQSRMDSYA